MDNINVGFSNAIAFREFGHNDLIIYDKDGF